MGGIQVFSKFEAAWFLISFSYLVCNTFTILLHVILEQVAEICSKSFPCSNEHLSKS